jgi:hypothetical protein
LILIVNGAEGQDGARGVNAGSAGNEAGCRSDVEASEEGPQVIGIEQMFNKLSGADTKTQKRKIQNELSNC